MHSRPCSGVVRHPSRYRPWLPTVKLRRKDAADLNPRLPPVLPPKQAQRACTPGTISTMRGFHLEVLEGERLCLPVVRQQRDRVPAAATVAAHVEAAGPAGVPSLLRLSMRLRACASMRCGLFAVPFCSFSCSAWTMICRSPEHRSACITHRHAPGDRRILSKQLGLRLVDGRPELWKSGERHVSTDSCSR